MNKPLVRKADYECYTMSLPFRVIRRRQRSIFVRRELEKRHPLFSEKCCTDTKLLLRKGKLTAEVAVMDKVRLAEYKKMFPHKNLFLEGNPQRAVFRRKSAGVKIIVLGAVIVLAGAKLLWRKDATDPNAVVASEKADASAAVALLAPETVFASILSAVSKKGGKITAFSWQGGNTRVVVTGCYPEDVVPDTSCTVSYANNEPRFEVSIPVTPGAHLPAGGDSHFVQGLRHALLQRGMVILGEQVGEKDASIHLFVQHSEVGEALKICAEQAEILSWHERELSLQSGENGCDIKASFSSGAQFYAELSPFETVALYASVFEPKPFAAKIRARTVRPEQVLAVRDKVGEIRRLDGTVFAYYRLSDGHIVCEKAQ